MNKNINMKIFNARMEGLKLIESLDEIFRVKWKPVPSHPHYYVSNRGQVINKRTGKTLKPRNFDFGVTLSSDGKHKLVSLIKLIETLYCRSDAVRAYVSTYYPHVSWDRVDMTRSYPKINYFMDTREERRMKRLPPI